MDCRTRSFDGTLAGKAPLLRGQTLPGQVAGNPLLLNAAGATLEVAQYPERDEAPLK